MQASGDWDFPNGTVLMKNFRIGTRLIETRLFMRHPDGNWGGFTYEWNAQQTDATLVQGGAVRDHRQRPELDFPERSAVPGVSHERARAARSDSKPRNSTATSRIRRPGARRTSSSR